MVASPLRVLLVEDDPLTTKVVRALLRACGYEVLLASNGRQAMGEAGDALGPAPRVSSEHPAAPHSAAPYATRPSAPHRCD